MTSPKYDTLVTVATHLDVVEAAILQSRLDAEGIESYLIDGNISDIAWHLANAVGGAKLQVKSSDARQAIKIADTKPDVEDSDVDEWPIPSPRTSLLDKAFKIGLLGILFFPLQLYSLWLLMRALRLKSEDSMLGKCMLVLFVNSPTIASMGLIFAFSLGAFDQTDMPDTIDGIKIVVFDGIP